MKIKELLPSFVHKYYMVCQTFGYDVQRVLCYGFGYSHTKSNLKARLLMVLHTLEKGLTMPNSRPCFGKDKIEQIYTLVNKLGKEEVDSFEMQYASQLIYEYELFHKIQNYELSEYIVNQIKKIRTILPPPPVTQCIDKQSVQLHFNVLNFFSKGNSISQFIKSRHTIRNYTDTPIKENIFIEVAELANCAPSSCNRQSCRMHVITEKKHLLSVMDIQGGCRGFGSLSTAVIIVTSDLRCFYDVQERSQPAINSGFFGMNILLGLHERGIGACVLNWSNTKKRDKQLRRLVPTILESEQIEFLICCGYPPEEFDVALSKRKPVEDCVCFVDKKDHENETFFEGKSN